MLSSLWDMAASYSSFLSTRYYSPVFNTALFDGPFRIYFSQAYEGVALKIYHLLQNQHQELGAAYKQWCDRTKKHVFILIYPTREDLNFVVDFEVPEIKLDHYSADWDEGRLIAGALPQTDENFAKFFEFITNDLKTYLRELDSPLDSLQDSPISDLDGV